MTTTIATPALAQLAVFRIAAGQIDAMVREVDGVTPRQLEVLAAVARIQPCAQVDLIGPTGVDRSTLKNIVARLAALCLIEIGTDRRDRRRTVLTITQAGLDHVIRGERQAAGILQDWRHAGIDPAVFEHVAMAANRLRVDATLGEAQREAAE